MNDNQNEILSQQILPYSERTITGAKLHKPFIHKEYSELCSRGAQGRRVLVVGSGLNTQRWRDLSCTTLDLDPQFNPDLVADANYLGKAVNPESQSIIISEYLTLDPTGREGVNLDLFLPQVFASLVKGGKFFFVSAAAIIEPPERITILPPNEFLGLLKKNGFRNVASWNGPLGITMKAKQVGTKQVVDDFYADLAVIYYGQKVVTES